MKRKIHMQRLLRIAIAAGVLSAAALSSAFAEQPVDAEAAARADWRAVMLRNTESAQGCFQASYPSTVWEKVDCKHGHPRFPPVAPKPTTGWAEVTGNGHDYVAEAAGLITETVGTFSEVTGVENERSVGVAAFRDAGILGPNEYELQINSNYKSTTSACTGGNSDCTVWQQFLYAMDYETKGEADVFIEYWLLDWGTSACPGGYSSDGMGNCWMNSDLLPVPDMPITALGSLQLSAAAAAGGNDRYSLMEALCTLLQAPTASLIFRPFGQSPNSTSSVIQAVRERFSMLVPRSP